MSNEIKNRQHAIALIAPVPAAPFTRPIVSAVGVGGFTRNSIGNYTIELTDAAPFHVTVTTASLGANVLGIVNAQLAPDGGSVLVTAFQGLAPFDPQFFNLAVDVVRDGEGIGPAPALPSPPTPPTFSSFVRGWCVTDLSGGIFNQSSNTPVVSITKTVTGIYDYLIDPGDPQIPLGGCSTATVVQSASVIQTDSTGPFAVQVRTWDVEGVAVLADSAHQIVFYNP